MKVADRQGLDGRDCPQVLPESLRRRRCLKMLREKASPPPDPYFIRYLRIPTDLRRPENRRLKGIRSSYYCPLQGADRCGSKGTRRTSSPSRMSGDMLRDGSRTQTAPWRASSSAMKGGATSAVDAAGQMPPPTRELGGPPSLPSVPLCGHKLAGTAGPPVSCSIDTAPPLDRPIPSRPFSETQGSTGL